MKNCKYNLGRTQKELVDLKLKSKGFAALRASYEVRDLVLKKADHQNERLIFLIPIFDVLVFSFFLRVAKFFKAELPRLPFLLQLEHGPMKK